jgi:hypothetical protein
MLAEVFLLGLGFAQAAPVPVSHAVSYSHVFNDPFILRRGLRYDLRLDLAPQLAVGVGASFYPDFGQGDWRSTTRVLVEEWRVAPSVSRLVAEGALYAEMVPVRAELDGGRTSEIRARLGVGAVRTRDDLVMSSREDDGLWIATENQVHPAYEAALLGRLRSGKVAFEGGVRRVTYVEVQGSGFLEFKSNAMVQVGVAWAR